MRVFKTELGILTASVWLLLLGHVQGILIPPPATDDVSTETCSGATEYYDESILGCNKCTGPSGGAGSPSSLLVPDPHDLNALGLVASCTCSDRSYSWRHDDSYCASVWPAPCNLNVCTRCKSNEAPTQDLSRCLPCGPSTLGIDQRLNDCKCPLNAVLLEKNSTGAYLTTKECLLCSDDTYRDPVSNQCKSCGDDGMAIITKANGERACECRSGYQRVTSVIFDETRCIAQTRTAILNTKVNLNLASVVSFGDFLAEETGRSDSSVSFESALVQDMFHLAASECYFYRNEKQMRYCQALGNLCVLEHFRPGSPPCALLDLIQKSGRVTTANNIPGWYYTLPFLNYWSNAQSVLASASIGMQMSFDESSHPETHDHVEFIVAVYAINGTLKGFRKLTNQMLYCIDSTAALPSSTSPLWTRFGVSTKTHFTCDLAGLESDGMELYEMFLIDKSKDEHDDGRYLPVPVQNLNFRDERGLYLNRNSRASDKDDDVLTHRFFLFDVRSGVRSGETKTKVYRYASSITITVKTQTKHVDRIHPPYLSISYVDTQTPSRVSVKFEVVYASETGGFWSTAITIFVIACVVAGLRILLHMFTWQRRNTRNEEMALTAWHSLSFLTTSIVSNYARATFTVLFVMCTYFLIFFKLQTRVFVLLPELNAQLAAASMDEYYPFRVVLPMAFAFQLAAVLYRVALQTRVQLFFLDWEKPRAKILDVDASQTQPAPVSIWRTILVANEWNEIQTVRRTSLSLTLIVLLFVLYGCDLRSAALPIPQSQLAYMTARSANSLTLATDQDLPLNLYLRFANVASIWLLVCISQRLWKWLIYERYFDEPREQLFIDLCTIAKVSCFILDETYHGFYLHCRSPYPYADGSMSEIVERLKQEEAGLTAGRGLESSIPECQTFEMFMTRKWKRKFLSLHSMLHSAGRTHSSDEKRHGPSRPFSAHRGGGPSALSLWQPSSFSGWHSSSSTLVTQGMVQHATGLCDFLKSFIENQDDQFRWRIYRMETCVSRFFGVPPEMSTTRQSFFLPDTSSRFCRVMFLGIENDLMLLNILCFTAFDLWLDNHAISAFATYVLEQLLIMVRMHFGNRNVARNTLVDSRFLI